MKWICDRIIYPVFLLATVYVFSTCNINAVTLASIEITTQPTKTEYLVGDSIDTTGMVVMATYSDNTTKDVTSSVMMSGFDSSTTVDDQIVTVSYTENNITKTSAFKVTIIEFKFVNSGLNNIGVNGTYEIKYKVAASIDKIDFYKAFGKDASSGYEKIKTDEDLSGSLFFDTTFTGINWVTVKGIATTDSGKEIADMLWFNVDNYGPDVCIEPRDSSRIKSLSKMTFTIRDGGATGSVDYDETEISLQNETGSSISLNSIDKDENNILSTSPTITLSSGKYEISIVAYDILENKTEETSSFYIVDSNEDVPTIQIVTPDWNGEDVSGDIVLSYTSSKSLTQLVLDCSSGQGEPYVFGSFPSITINNPEQNGSITIDTTFTGTNWVSFRLFGISEDNLSATSNVVYCHITNN